LLGVALGALVTLAFEQRLARDERCSRRAGDARLRAASRATSAALGALVTLAFEQRLARDERRRWRSGPIRTRPWARARSHARRRVRVDA
jgi:hypothetical protein